MVDWETLSNQFKVNTAGGVTGDPLSNFLHGDWEHLKQVEAVPKEKYIADVSHAEASNTLVTNNYYGIDPNAKSNPATDSGAGALGGLGGIFKDLMPLIMIMMILPMFKNMGQSSSETPTTMGG